MKHTKTRPILMLSLTALLALGLQSCAGKKDAKPEEQATAKDAVDQLDMTRPPRTIGVEREIVVEQNPNETISFEEWKRRQEAGSSESPE